MPVLERGGAREWRRRTTAEQRLRFFGALGLTAVLVAAGLLIGAGGTSSLLILSGVAAIAINMPALILKAAYASKAG